MIVIGRDINIARKELEAGGLVAIPTETVYGLAANAFDEQAVASIFEAKNRPAFDPLIVHTNSIEKAVDFVASFSPTAKLLADAFWPGPLTLILPKTTRISDLVTSGHDTVGVRIPDHELTLSLLAKLPFPVAAPSANPFGYVSPTRAVHVQNQLKDKVDYILDGGEARVGLESTIVRCLEGEVEVLRVGGLSIENLEAVLGRKVDRVKTSSSNPEAPGMLSSHYNPGKSILIGDIDKLLAEIEGKTIGVLSFSNKRTSAKIVKQLVLSESRDLTEAARNLFAALREFDTAGIDIVLAEFVPEEGLGRAINDRLKRAAAK